MSTSASSGELTRVCNPVVAASEGIGRSQRVVAAGAAVGGAGATEEEALGEMNGGTTSEPPNSVGIDDDNDDDDDDNADGGDDDDDAERASAPQQFIRSSPAGAWCRAAADARPMAEGGVPFPDKEEGPLPPQLLVQGHGPAAGARLRALERAGRARDNAASIYHPADANTDTSIGCADIESALDQLTSQMAGGLSLTRDYTAKMASYLVCEDLAERIEATQVYRQSLAARLEPDPKAADANTVYRSGPEGGANPGAMGRRDSMHLLEVSISDLTSRPVLLALQESLNAPQVFVRCNPQMVLLLQVETALLLGKMALGTTEELAFIFVSNHILQTACAILASDRITDHNCPEANALRKAILDLITRLVLKSDAVRCSILSQNDLLKGIIAGASVAVDKHGLSVVNTILPLIPELRKSPGLIPDVEEMVKYLALALLAGPGDPKIVELALMGCVHVCEKGYNGIALILNSGALVPVIGILCSPECPCTFEALSVVAKIAFSGTTDQINQMISYQVVEALIHLLRSPRTSNTATRARACNTLGNIGCETPFQVAQIIAHGGCSMLVHIFRHDPDYNTRIEAAYAVCSCASRANENQVAYIVTCTSNVPSCSTWEDRQWNSRFFPCPPLEQLVRAPQRSNAPFQAAPTLDIPGLRSQSFSCSSLSMPELPAAAASSALDRHSSVFLNATGVLHSAADAPSANLPLSPLSLPSASIATHSPEQFVPKFFVSGVDDEDNCMKLVADMLELVRASDPLNPGNVKLCKAILRGLHNILEHGAKLSESQGVFENPYATMFAKIQGDKKLAEMQFFPDFTVAEKTQLILIRYFTKSATAQGVLR
eukprot:GHVT01082580.1.p1 GENE.GHVT01082580.1~~GHVT01082580.1.p1  ORF type:complete len:835 (+),score=175.34 GHVT01082580.1:702-3206(+)